jgi:hypothetical protein
MGLIDYESTCEKVIEILLQNYSDIIKLHTITAAHTVTFPGMDYEQFDTLFRKLFEGGEISY